MRSCNMDIPCLASPALHVFRARPCDGVHAIVFKCMLFPLDLNFPFPLLWSHFEHRAALNGVLHVGLSVAHW